MLYNNASDYFRDLMTVLLQTQITDQHGAPVSLDTGAQQAVDLVLKAGIANKLMIIGNGGSAAVASHVYTDVVKAVGIKALIFTEPSLLTALSNDLSYADAYEQQVQMWAAPGDLLLAISSSGKSPNILRAAQAAIQHQCGVITFSGFQPDNPLRRLGVLNFYVASDLYGFVELNHASLLHFLTDAASIQWQVHLHNSASALSPG